jgi:hypothetical protein
MDLRKERERLVRERMVRERFYFDAATILTQLGLVGA